MEDRDRKQADKTVVVAQRELAKKNPKNIQKAVYAELVNRETKVVDNSVVENDCKTRHYLQTICNICLATLHQCLQNIVQDKKNSGEHVMSTDKYKYNHQPFL